MTCNPGPKRVRFVHVPRTGGMTVYRHTDGRFVGSSEVGHGYWENTEGAWCRNMALSRLVGSHWPYDPSPTYHQVTCLRDPVERGLSLWRQAKKLRGDNPLVCDHAYNVVPYVEGNVWVCEAMTRQLAGIPIPTMGEVTEATFRIALHNLRSCKVVGVTEDLPSFIERVNHLLGRPSPFAIERVNAAEVTADARDVEDARGILSEINHWDRKLWEEARCLNG